MHIGGTIKKALKERGVTPAEVADICGVTRGAVSNWFSTGRINKENLVKVAGILQVTVEELVSGGLGERTSKPLAPLPLASLADDTMTLLSLFNQLGPVARANVISFAQNQGAAKSESHETASTTTLKSPAARKPRALQDKGAISKRPASESSGVRGRKALK